MLGACARTLVGQAGGRLLSPALRDLLAPVVTLWALYRLEQASCCICKSPAGMGYVLGALCRWTLGFPAHFTHLPSSPINLTPLQDLAWFMCEGLLPVEAGRAVPDAVRRLCAQLAPHWRTLVAGFGIPVS